MLIANATMYISIIIIQIERKRSELCCDGQLLHLTFAFDFSSRLFDKTDTFVFLVFERLSTEDGDGSAPAM